MNIEGIIRKLVDQESQSRNAAAEKERLDQEQDKAQEFRSKLATRQMVMRGKAVSEKKKVENQLKNRIANHNALLFMISQGKEQGRMRQIEECMSRSRSALHSNPGLEKIYRSHGVDLDVVERNMKEEAKRKAGEWFLEQCEKNPDVDALERLNDESIF